MGVNKKTKPLRNVLILFLIRLLICIMLAIAVPIGVFIGLTITGFVNYANRSEMEALSVRAELVESEDPGEILRRVSPRIRYAWYSNQNELLLSSLKDEELIGAKQYYSSREQGDDVRIRYLAVDRAEDYIIIQYKIGTYYTIEALNVVLPSPEKAAILMVIILAIVLTIIETHRFEKNLLSELDPLLSATRSFSAHNLDYDVGTSHITEINEMLQAFSLMKTELRESLQQQWKAEAEKRDQIAALSHDVKSPLTVAIGNLDLLEENSSDQGTKRLITLALENLEKISDYMDLLVEMTTSSSRQDYCFTDFQVEAVVESIINRAEGMCKLHDIRLQSVKGDLPDYLYGDAIMIERAVVNIVQNAIDHARGAKNVCVNIQYQYDTKSNGLRIEVTDDGEGFSEAALKHGKEMLYMDSQARSNERHYGIGLFLAWTVAEKHGGTIELMNSPITGGGMVVMSGLCAK